MQHILMSSSAHQCCVSSGLIQENIGVLFYLQVPGHHFTRRAYSEIAYSAEYRLQTKWICSSLQQKLVTELRQNFLLFLLFFFFFLRKEQVENKNSSSQLWCSFFLLCSQQKNLNVPILSEKPRAMFFILVLCFIFTITLDVNSAQFFNKKVVFPTKQRCTIQSCSEKLVKYIPFSSL